MLIKTLILAAAYFLLARFGMQLFSLQPSNITLIWLPSGIAVVMFLETGWRSVPWVIVASFAANLGGIAAGGTHNPILHTAISALADASVGPLAALFLQRKLPGGLSQARDLLPFSLYACLLPTALSGIVITTNLITGGYVAAAQASNFLFMLLMADSLGILLVHQVYQGWHDNRLLLGDAREKRWLIGTAVVATLILLLSFRLQAGLVYFIIPTLLLLAFNVRMLGVALISGTSILAIIVATAQGSGPFIADTSTETNFRLMIFAFSVALTIFGVCLQKRQLLLSEQSSLLWKNAAELDALSNLLNRRAFLPRLDLEHERSKRAGRPYTLAMLDIDHFKQINDTHGHLVGDRVICALAQTMQQCTRSIDLIARMGGEEFCILLPEITEAQAQVPLERIRKQFENTVLNIDGVSVNATVSIGVASCQPHDMSWYSVMQRADTALYAAKDAGRNRMLLAA